ncbi:MAG TPA: hypothetical protein PLR07_07590 [Promineifilum sp.]|nr:hypothetical protein [Promineifilum sp.]
MDNSTVRQYLIERLNSVRDEDVIKRITTILQNAFPEIMLDTPTDINSNYVDNDSIDQLPFPIVSNDREANITPSDSHENYYEMLDYWDGSSPDDDWDRAEANTRNSGCPFCGSECYCNYGLESTT